MGMVTYPPQPFPPSSGKTGDIAERVTELESNVSTLQTTKAPKTDIAPAFSAETNYSVGDLVYYNGALYECITEHTAGAWDLEDFNETTIDEQLNAINSNLTNIADIKAYTTDAALCADFYNVNKYSKVVVLYDTTKTMAILHAIDRTSVFVHLIASTDMWKNHPNFIAVTNTEMFVGVLSVGDGTVSVVDWKKLAWATQ